MGAAPDVKRRMVRPVQAELAAPVRLWSTVMKLARSKTALVVAKMRVGRSAASLHGCGKDIPDGVKGKFHISFGFGPKLYGVTFGSVEREIPVCASFEDDMVSIAKKYGSCFKDRSARDGREFERSRFRHSFAIYRGYRAFLRLFSRPAVEEFTVGELTRPYGGRLSSSEVLR